MWQRCQNNILFLLCQSPNFGVSGQTHLKGKNFAQIISIPSGSQPLDFQARFGGAFLLEQVERNVPQNSQILRRIISPCAIGVLMKGDIERPVELIFDFPVTPGRISEACGIGGQRRQVVADKSRDLLPDAPLGLNHRNGP